MYWNMKLIIILILLVKDFNANCIKNQNTEPITIEFGSIFMFTNSGIERDTTSVTTLTTYRTTTIKYTTSTKSTTKTFTTSTSTKSTTKTSTRTSTTTIIRI